MGNALVKVSVEKIQNKTAIITGENQKCLKSLPERIPIKIESRGFTTKNKARQMSIPASREANSIEIRGIMSITNIMERRIISALFNLLIISTYAFF